MRKLIALIAGLSAVAAFSTAAQAGHYEFVSQHPVPHKFGDGFCYITVPHVHNYPPGDARMYREAHGRHYFVGDPAPFGYEGPRYSYYGAHPIVEAEVQLGHPIYCYLKGPHFHWYQPPPRAQFQLSGGAYWYVGSFPPVYYQERPHYAVINEAYAPVVYTRPTVDIAVAPPLVRAEISLGGPGWSAHAVVGGPPAPVFVPAPPPLVAPVQVGVGVGINIGGPAVVVGAPGGPPGHFRHDRGRHEGWRQQSRRGQPARFITGPAPVRQPLFQHQRGQTPRFAPAPHAGPGPGRPPTARGPAPTPRLSPTPAPTRGPAPTQARGSNPPGHRP